ncbi:hypothetical protein [Pseudomonas sp. MWU12-2037]|uniref:hypothetical protein n=1 Tax=Pseudomonas sp. MWU12-2037 TaxID=2928690 RepID=UPI00200DDCE1|nr:hypothetical protein [Pseudomonas sp. MWU12-2037]
MFAVPLCGGVVYAIAKGMLIGWSDSVLFSGFLFGSVISIVLGIPLLLLGDRHFDRFRARHMVSGLIQSLVACLLVGAWGWHLLVMTMLSGLALGVLYSVTVSGIDLLPASVDAPLRSRWGRVVSVPLSGGVTLGMAAVLFLSDGAAFILFSLIGALLGMLVGWPVLWGVERFLKTRLRYVIAGMLSALLIWLASIAPAFLGYPAALSKGAAVWPTLFWHGAIVFPSIGLLSGCVCMLFNWLCQRCCYTQDKD